MPRCGGKSFRERPPINPMATDPHPSPLPGGSCAVQRRRRGEGGLIRGVGWVELVVDSVAHGQGYSGGIAASAVRGRKTSNLRTHGVAGCGLRTDVVDTRSSNALADESAVAPVEMHSIEPG